MHPELKILADALGPSGPHSRAQHLRFGLLCVQAIRDNLEEDAALQLLDRFETALAAPFDAADPLWDALARDAQAIAGSHPGSKSIDGTRHAAVSATYALAKAVQGQAVDAAAYAAYSKIYAYGGYAVQDPSAFAEEHQRQLALWRQLHNRESA